MKKGLCKLLALTIITVTVLAGCGPTAHIETGRNVNFNQYRSFAWAQPKDRHREDMAEQRVKEAISTELQRTRGWQESNRYPDVLLSYDVLVERGSRAQSSPVYSWSGFRTFYNPYSRRFYNVYYPSQFMGYNNYEVPVREGTVTITMTDARTEKIIMQGWATDEVSTRRLSSSEVDRIVASIFRKWDSQSRYDSRYTRSRSRYGSSDDYDRYAYPDGNR